VGTESLARVARSARKEEVCMAIRRPPARDGGELVGGPPPGPRRTDPEPKPGWDRVSRSGRRGPSDRMLWWAGSGAGEEQRPGAPGEPRREALEASAAAGGVLLVSEGRPRAVSFAHTGSGRPTCREASRILEDSLKSFRSEPSSHCKGSRLETSGDPPETSGDPPETSPDPPNSRKRRRNLFPQGISAEFLASLRFQQFRKRWKRLRKRSQKLGGHPRMSQDLPRLRASSRFRHL
jgi:hypothetical protein